MSTSARSSLWPPPLQVGHMAKPYERGIPEQTSTQSLRSFYGSPNRLSCEPTMHTRARSTPSISRQDLFPASQIPRKSQERRKLSTSDLRKRTSGRFEDAHMRRRWGVTSPKQSQQSYNQHYAPEFAMLSEVARLEAETDRILTEQKRLDLERLRATINSPPVTPPPKLKRSLLGLNLSPLSWRRRASASPNMSPLTSDSEPVTPTKTPQSSVSCEVIEYSPSINSSASRGFQASNKQLHFPYKGAPFVRTAEKKKVRY